MRAQLRRATEKYGPFNSKVLARASSQPLDKEVDHLRSGNRVIGSLHIDNVGNIDHEVAAKPGILPNGNSVKSSRADQVINDLGGLRNSSASSEICQSDDTDNDKGGHSGNKSLENIKKPDSIVIPDDYLCPISLELMRDPVIVATGQV